MLVTCQRGACHFCFVVVKSAMMMTMTIAVIVCVRKERHDVAKSNVQVRTHLFTFDVCVRTRIALTFDFNECVNASAASDKRDVDTDVVRIQSNF